MPSSTNLPNPIEDDASIGAASVTIAATRERMWFGMDRRLVVLLAPPIAILILFSKVWWTAALGLALAAALVPVLRTLGSVYPYFLDDFFGSWEFEQYYAADAYLVPTLTTKEAAFALFRTERDPLLSYSDSGRR